MLEWGHVYGDHQCGALVPVPVLVVGVRDEFVAREWDGPGRHWPERPGVRGRDLRAGGTWLAVEPDAPRVAVVLNGRGRMAPEASRASRESCRCGWRPRASSVNWTSARSTRSTW